MLLDFSESELSNELTDIYSRLEHIEADKAPAKASCILHGLGFTSSMQKQMTKEFSGGWRMRLALARALFSKYDSFHSSLISDHYECLSVPSCDLWL